MRERRGRVLELAAYGLALTGFVGGFVHERLNPPPYEPGERVEGTLRVMTWNVGEGIDQGGRGLRDEFVPHVAHVINTLDADLCFLQEVNGRLQLRSLLRELGSGWDAVLSRSSSRRVAAVFRRGEVEPFEVDGGGARTLGILYLRPGRQPVAAIGLHANAFSAADRNEEIGAAAAALRGMDDAVARLLLGDLNLDLDLDKRRDLFTDDAYRDVETYNFVARDLVDAARGRGTTAEPDRRLDYVFVDDRRFEILDAGPWYGRRAGGMDHDPVVADLVPRD